jgi:hypothetical protein
VGTEELRELRELQDLKILDQAQSEIYTRRSRWSLFRACANGRLRRISGGRRPLYERAALEEWIRAGRPTGEERGSGNADLFNSEQKLGGLQPLSF